MGGDIKGHAAKGSGKYGIARTIIWGMAARNTLIAGEESSLFKRTTAMRYTIMLMQ
jgi:hypothetical protein